MVLAKLIVFVSLYCVANAASGYIAMDLIAKVSCFNMPNYQICPASFNHQVVGVVVKPEALTKLSLHAVKTEVAGAAILGATGACLNDVREYSCSNTLMKCTKNTTLPYGIKLDFDSTRTRKACAKVKKSCSADVQAATIHNCSVIQTNPMEFAICEKLPTVAGDICPCTDYMYPKALAKFYPIQAKAFSALFHKFTTQFKALKNIACEDEFKGVYCQILRGGICSITKRLFAISQQDCSVTMTKCVTNPIFKAHLQEVCKLLPDRSTNTAPLPVPPVTTCIGNVATGNGANANNGNSGK